MAASPVELSMVKPPRKPIKSVARSFAAGRSRGEVVCWFEQAGLRGEYIYSLRRYRRSSRQSDALLAGNLAQQIGTVGDNSIHSDIDHSRHVGGFVYRPHHDRQSETMGFGDDGRVDIAIVWRPDRASGGLYRARQRPSMLVRVEPRRPWRRLVEKDRRRKSRLLAQIYGRYPGRQFLDDLQRAPVERLNHDPVAEILGLQESKNERDKVLGVRRFVRVVWIYLGFDVETHMTAA